MVNFSFVNFGVRIISCRGQLVANTPFLLLLPISSSTRVIFFLFYSIILLSDSEHVLKSKQLIPRILGSDQVSYKDWRTNIGALTYLQRYCANIQLTLSLGKSCMHYGVGGSIQALVNFIRLIIYCRYECIFVCLFYAS